jgi:cysteine-S-conjugate beta-lyase
MAYLDGNRRSSTPGVNAIPGLRSMPLEATYLSWVDFSGTGMPPEEFTRGREGCAHRRRTTADLRRRAAKLPALQHRHPPRAVEEAVARLQAAFGDLQ